jgi:hypothetical protein
MQVLYFLWDPIGVNDEPAARGEYKSYALTVEKMVVEKKPAKEIADYLQLMEKEHMGFDPTQATYEHCIKIAELCIETKDAIDDKLA